MGANPVRIALFAAFACGCSALASGQTAAAPQPSPNSTSRAIKDISEISLDDALNQRVGIAAGRLQRPEESPSIVSVITDVEIRKRGARVLSDILQTVPGFEVLLDNAGRERITTRGIVATEAVLVLFKGQRLNEHISGGAFQVNLTIPLYNIKRIEIIRGPASALYGTNAFLAVINLVPYSPGDFEGLELSAAAGSFATQEYAATYGRVFGDQSGLILSGQFADTDGPALVVGSDAATAIDRTQRLIFGLPPISLAPGFAARDRRSLDLMFSANIGKLDVDARYRDNRGGGYLGLFDIVGPRSKLESAQFVAAITRPLSLPSDWTLTPRFAYTHNRVDALFDAFPPGTLLPTLDGGFLGFPEGLLIDTTTNTRRYETSAVLTSSPRRHFQHTFGVAYERESTFDVTTRMNFNIFNRMPLATIQPAGFAHLDPASRSIVGVFGQEQVTLGTVSLTGGVRYDHYDDFGNTVNPRAGMVWRLPNNLHIQALYGEAFRAPSFQERGFKVPGFLNGSAGLQPARARTGELALNYVAGGWRASADYFRTSARDLILSTDPLAIDSSTRLTTYINTPGLVSRGVEFDVQRNAGIDRSFFANYVIQRVTEKVTGRRAADTPTHVVNGGFTVRVSDYVALSPTLMARSGRARAFGDIRPAMPAYGVVNMNARIINVFETLELALTIENLFDKRYAVPSFSPLLPGDYPVGRRGVFVRGSYKF